MPWYLTPAALAILKRLRAAPPELARNTSGNPLLTNAGYRGADADALRTRFTLAWEAMNRAGWDADTARELLETSANEVLAALFGDPDGLDWAHPDRAARRTALALEIDAALAVQVAA
ncbi:MAG: hypothetical protein KGM49_00445 [Sphingomonadales bacterium]|nr:hypothetical protein [Sphingomonadales bacterium]